MLIGVATAIVVIAIAVMPFLAPQWVAFEQGRANAAGWTGYSANELNAATGAILSDLVFGPADFDVQVRGQAVLDERERDHMRDVRTVFGGLVVLAAISVLVLLIAALRAERRAAWRAVRHGAIGLGGAIVVLGGVAFVAFDALFEAFHAVLFPAGSYDFDPATERLVQLFPFQFWQETAIVVGVVIVVACVVVASVAGARAGRPAAANETSPGLAAAPGAQP